MKRLAVDIVLLPSNPMADRVIEVNRELVRRCGGEITLDRKNCFPHISLCMGVLKGKDLPAVSEILERIGMDSPPLNLTATRLTANPDAKGEPVSCFEIRKTRALVRLHETIMNKLGPFLTYKVTEEMLFSPPPISEGTLRWIKTYPGKSAFRNFRPHITAGFGNADPIKHPIRFIAPELALCHLGNHCTCRKILASASFR
jgi:hypothetical protein